jgi:hypothetical protein
MLVWILVFYYLYLLQTFFKKGFTKILINQKYFITNLWTKKNYFVKIEQYSIRRLTIIHINAITDFLIINSMSWNHDEHCYMKNKNQ